MRDLINRKVIYMLYGVCLILLIVGLFFFSRKPKTTLETPFTVMDVLEKIKLPVVKESDTIIGRPYTETKVSIVQSYYDYKASEENQKNLKNKKRLNIENIKALTACILRFKNDET